MNEFALIEALKRKIPCSPQVPVGMGDDAAVLNVSKDKQLVVSTDAIVENVDFRIKELPPAKVGRKSLAINLSDMAAMGAKPTAFVITIGKPSYMSSQWLMRFYNGLLAIAKEYDVHCIGGDFSKSKEFFASITILGEVSSHQTVIRSGAMVGDWIAVTGALGGSLLRHHYDFTPRVHEGIYLAENFTPTAMIDISDGLCQDLGHILKASGVGACLDLAEIPISKGSMKMSSGNREKALKRALSDGEDFELLFTLPPWQKVMLERSWKKKFPKVPLTWIGRVEGKKPQIRWLRDGKQVMGPGLLRKGYVHFK